MGRINPAFFHARSICPVCRGGAVEPIYSAPLDAGPVRDFIASQYRSQGEVHWAYFGGTDFEVMQCQCCDLIYQRNVPDGPVLNHVYYEMIAPKFLDGIEHDRLTVDNFHKIAGEMAVLFRMAGKHPGDIRFLDYGFGHGRWARVARAMGAQVFATETGEEKKAAAAALGIQIVSDAEIDAMRFDIVHTEQVLEHLTEPGRDFRRLAAVTDRLLKVSVPERGRLGLLLKRKGLPSVAPFSKNDGRERLSAEDDAYTAIQPLEHLNAFSARTMEYLAIKNRMSIVSRVRRRAIAIEMDSPALLLRSMLRLGTMVAKTVLQPDLGYYLFRPSR